MKKWSNKKAEWLLVMLAVSLTASASWTITAEEKSEAIDRYIIVELETLLRQMLMQKRWNYHQNQSSQQKKQLK